MNEAIERLPRRRQAGGRIRIRFWNIAGTIGDVCRRSAGEGWDTGVLEGVEVLVLTETGFDRPSQGAQVAEWCKHGGWERVACSMRPYDHKHGGVAVFVKRGGRGQGGARTRRIQAGLVREQPELGQVWVRVRLGGGPWLYVGAVYLPPKASTYYNREEGRELSADKHWWALREGVMEMKGRGQVVLVGDFNCRMGDEQGNGQCAPDMVGERHSRDRTWDNATGGKLSGLCEECGLVVLNGRMPGDSWGELTFHSRTGRGQSVVDYAVATPGVVWEPDGEIRSGSSLEVWPQSKRVVGYAGGVYDHQPVTLTVMVGASGGGEPRGDAGREGAARRQRQVVSKLRWQDSCREKFVQALKSEGEARDLLTGIRPGVGGEGAARAIEQAVYKAAAQADASGTAQGAARLVMRAREGGRKAGDRPRNPWYNQECEAARRACVAVVREHGGASEQAVAARKAYKSTTRRAKRQWVEDDLEGKRAQLVRDPRRFWTAYKGQGGAAQVKVEEWTPYFGELLQVQLQEGEVDEELRARLVGRASAGEQAFVAAGVLSRDITEQDVAKAMGALARGKSAGLDGIPAEFLKEAWAGEGAEWEHALLGPTTRALNEVFRCGYPDSWRVGVVCPVPKKVGATEKDDHRGIVVGTALSKLYSQVLLNRLDEWAEKYGVRAKGQFGFRKGKGTEDATLVLQHVAEVYREESKPVYTAFVDFRKAYDSVDRGILWECLEQLGIRGRMLAAVKDMYKVVKLRVRAGGELGEEFKSDRGVKQGDPLSPLLFGLMLERIERVFEEELGGEGVRVGGARVSIMLYADDLVIMGETPDLVQRALDLLHRCCKCLHMEVNVGKTVGMVLNPRFHKGPGVTWRYNGQTVAMVGSFKYLGTVIEAGGGVNRAWVKAEAAARRAKYGMLRRVGTVGMDAADLKLYLFQALVKPVLDFGSAIWGPKAAQARGAGEGVEALQLKLLRMCVGVKATTANAVLYREMGVCPVWVGWVRRAAGFWNRVVARDATDLVRLAVMDSCSMAARGVRGCWAAEFSDSVQRIAGGLGSDWRVDLEGLAALPQGLVRGGAAEWWRLGLNAGARLVVETELAPVREVPAQRSEGFKLLTHHRWFGSDWGAGVVKRTRFWQVLRDQRAVRVVAQLRMGAHRLAIETGRWVKPRKVPRAERVCRVCNAGVVEDEVHFLFECPGLAAARERYPDLFGQGWVGGPVSDASMHARMNPDFSDEAEAWAFWPKFHAFVAECWAMRDAVVEPLG